MEQPITIILLAPSGTGKSSYINRMRESGLNFTHINRDLIISKVLDDYRRGSQLCLNFNDHEAVNALLNEGQKLYHEHLALGIKENAPCIVIDYPPSNGKAGWAVEAATLSQKAGRRVVVEGITANPEVTLSRVLQRDSEGLGMSTRLPDMMGKDGTYHFRSWIFTYKNFPDQFLAVAKTADCAKLSDNSGNAPRTIAEWQIGNSRIIDENAYEQFLTLRDVDPDSAHFEAYIVGQDTNNGGVRHSFVTIPHRFFGAHRSGLAGNKAPQLNGGD